jgi:tRNA threonylcarbamoyladenosine biosynthesis protein TsaB
MTTVLAIDTSGPVTSLGIGRDGDAGAVFSEEGGRKHAEVIDQLMHRVSAELAGRKPDAIAVGVGPGPYSGLRVGIAFGIGLAKAWQLPVVGVCSLDAIAWEFAHEIDAASGTASEFVVITDARRNEIYWARYAAHAMRIAGPQVTSRGTVDFDVPVVSERHVDSAIMASKVAVYLEMGSAAVEADHQWAPHGADGSEVSVPTGPLLAPRPLYLRAPDITVSAKTPMDGIL